MLSISPMGNRQDSDLYVNSPTDNRSSISLDLCLKLFPLVMCLDSDGHILFCSERMSASLGSPVIGKKLFDIFKIEGPGERTLEDRKISKEDIGQLFLLSSTELELAFRGQVIEGMFDSKHVFIFLASPWLSWLYDTVSSPRISSADFPASDSQLEYQLNLCSSKEMLSDLKAFSKKLERAREQAESASRAKTKFVRHISHEIRTPLNGVITSLKLISQEPDESRKSRLLEIANSSAAALMDLVNEVLDFSRIEEGVFASSKESFNLRSMMREVEAGLSAKAAEKDMFLQFDLSPYLPTSVITDKRSLQRILYNLIGNAIKYSESDLVITRIGLYSRNKEHKLEIEVEDFGIGIPEQDVRLMFDAFWTADNKKSNEYSTGLGLSIVKEIIEKLGGTLSVESMLGQGTKFSFTMPIEEPTAQSTDTHAQTDQPPPGSRFHGKVLLVDDNAINLELAQILLGNLGLDIVTASDGAEAVATEKGQDFDLILMDIEMPILKGTEATVQIRGGGRNPDLPIVAMTANVSSDDIQHYITKGMNESLTKPVANEALVSLLARYLPYSAGDETNSPIDESESEEVSSMESLLDTETFDSLVNDIGSENAQRVIGMYIEQTSQQLGELVDLMCGDDLEKCRQVSHRIASSSLSFGLKRLGNRLREIEHAAKDGRNFTQAESVELKNMFAESKDALERACGA